MTAHYDPCPTPRKRGYPRISTALCAADKLKHKFDAVPYLCGCGRYHLTTRGSRADNSKRMLNRKSVS